MTNQQDLQAPTETVVIPIEEQISQELVKHNVTEALIADLKEKYLPLKLKDLNDKETYVIIRDARKECKSFRVMAEKICKKGREDANAISKAWVAKEKDVSGRIGEVEDHLEAQEKAFEAEQEKQKALRKRQQEEQLIRRQTQLTNMGALYIDGSFDLGEVSFELSLIKECEEDIWEEQILPKFKAEHAKVLAEELERQRKEDEQRAELKRQQEENERKQKELEQREADLKKAEEERLQREREDEERKENEARARQQDIIRNRVNQLTALGLVYNVNEKTHLLRDVNVHWTEVSTMTAQEWDEMIIAITPRVEQIKEEIEQIRLAQIEDQKKIERRNALNESRLQSLRTFDYTHPEPNSLADMPDEEWGRFLAQVKFDHEELKHAMWQKQQEEKKKQDEIKRQQEIDQAKDKDRWDDILAQLDKITIHDMRSGQYRKKAAILREKLEEVKAL